MKQLDYPGLMSVTFQRNIRIDPNNESGEDREDIREDDPGGIGIFEP